MPVLILCSEELPQDDDDKETVPAISPVDEQHRNFSYWVKPDDNYYQRQQKNKMASSPSSHHAKSVRFDDPLRARAAGTNRLAGKGHVTDFDPNDPSCYPLTGSGHEEAEFGRKGMSRYDTQDGSILV